MLNVSYRFWRKIPILLKMRETCRFLGPKSTFSNFPLFIGVFLNCIWRLVLKNGLKWLFWILKQNSYYGQKWRKWSFLGSRSTMGQVVEPGSIVISSQPSFTCSRIRCEICKICPNLTIKTPEKCHWRRSNVLLLTLKIFHTLF